MKSQSYMTRALKAKDPRFARVLRKLGYADAGATAVEVKPIKKIPKEDERTMLRAEYERVLGKRPFSGWDASELRSRIAQKSVVITDDGG